MTEHTLGRRMALCDRVVFVLFVLFVLSTLPRTSNGADDAACVFGGSCILPCSFVPGEELVIHWIQMKTGNPVHSFYHQQDQFDLQHQSFKGRTSLFKDQDPGKGNASLQLRGVTIQDEGKYKCYYGTTAGTKESFHSLNVYAPVRRVDIQRVENRLTCSSEGVYPKPELTWTTSQGSGGSNGTLQNQTTVQQTEQQLYNISSTLVDPAPDLDYSCTVRTPMSQRRSTWFPPTSISGSDSETTIPCRSSSSPPTGLIWRFNHSQVILNQTGSDFTVSEAWKPHVKSSSESGLLTLEDLTPNQEGIYTCELSDAEKTFISSSFLRLEESPDKKPQDSHNNDAAITGGVVGGVIGVILVSGLIAAATVAFRKYKSRNKKREEDVPRSNGRIPEELEMEPLNVKKMNEDQ